MQVSDPNNVKIYNLSVGKSLPDWLTERKRRALQKKSIDVRRRLELIQDFEMPDITSTVKTTRDGNYILTTGIYKPRVRCFDTSNLSMKFERCFDNEVINFEFLSDDYSKMVFLQDERYLEFHDRGGKFYRMRIPRYGRDLKLHRPSAELIITAKGSDIYRLNLELGRMCKPFESNYSEINCCAINDEHHLILTGSVEGFVEAWDHRSKERIATLDVASRSYTSNERVEFLPSITSLKCNGHLNMAVGLSTGKTLIYDLRSKCPFILKDQMNKLPIKAIDFHTFGNETLVLSMDSRTLKFWNENSGQVYTSIQANQNDFNNFCLIPKTGMIFVASETAKISTFYIPSIGPAPKWAGFLDSLVEELEETKPQAVFDDYRFITKEELYDIGLEHLEGTSFLRAYLHGYFIDVRLYRKAKSASDINLKDIKKTKIKNLIENERFKRGVQAENEWPKVNKDLAIKLTSLKNSNKKNNQIQSKLLEDPRFSQLFTNPEFQIDTETDEYRLLYPVISRIDKNKITGTENINIVKDEDKNDSSSSDDEKEWGKEVQNVHKKIKLENKRKEIIEHRKFLMTETTFQQKNFNNKVSEEKLTLQKRLENNIFEKNVPVHGQKEIKISLNHKDNDPLKQHYNERRKFVRPVRGLKSLKKSQTKF